MSPVAFVEQLLSLPDLAAQRRFLAGRASRVDDQVAGALKAQADRYLRSDVQLSLQTAELLCFLPELTGDPRHRALGLLAEANARSIGGLGQYERAISCYDEAAAIYQACGAPDERARSQVGKVWSLACLGRYDEAFETGAWAAQVLEEHSRWQQLGTLTMNLAAIHGRLGDDVAALAMLERARVTYLMLGANGEPYLPAVELNRAIVLRNLGQFDASIEASRHAQATLEQLGQPIEAARARQNLAITYYILGRYNEALALMDEVRSVLVDDGRHRDVVLLDVFTSDCLLQLRRFEDVLDRSRRARDLLRDLGVRFEAAQALLNEAAAYAGLARYEEALASLDRARRMFEAEPNPVWMAYADLETAAVLERQGRLEESLALAGQCADLLRRHELPVAEARACLVVAAAQVGLDQHTAARDAVDRALSVGRDKDLPALLYRCHHLLGNIARAEARLTEARTDFAVAIAELERLRGRLMIEFRAGFLEDKEVLYEDMIELCLDLDQPDAGLEYAERAKSRALVDMLAHHLDLDVQPRDVSDRPLTEKLARLRAERDRIHRRWLAGERLEGCGAPYDEGSQQEQREVLDLERQIVDVWHQLLVRRADYAADAALHQVRTEPVQPYLADDTLLLEWFVAKGRPILFLATRETIEARRLPVEVAAIRRLLSLLWLNFAGFRRGTPDQLESLTANARRLLAEIHDTLIAPVSDAVRSYPRWIIVPHGALHYLPFHALHDGSRFLIEDHEVSYLPGASLLRFCRRAASGGGTLAFGYSCEGRLPHAVDEARAVAASMGGQACVEDAATLARLREEAGACRVLHLATHGDFRADNPLFSGLALADGWLTTLDCFSLRLQASLVALSSCQTGRPVVGGGDELLGLTRALLSAGAASLVLSLWAVEDISTARLMEAFYANLVAGHTKGEALRRAQLKFIGREGSGDTAQAARYAHPYFWAPFTLVGDAGVL